MIQPNGAAALSSAFDDASEKITKALYECFGRNWTQQIDLYTYTRRFTSIANGGSGTDSIQINAGSTFIWTHGSASVRVSSTGVPAVNINGTLTGGALLPSWPFRIKLTDGGDQDELQSDYVHLGSLFGDVSSCGKMELARPRLWGPNSTILINLTRFAAGQVDQANAQVSVAMDVDLMFLGYRFKMAGMQNLTSPVGA